MTSKEWDKYWEKKNSKGYSFIASIYRKIILRPYLRHFLYKYFEHNSALLHAGCGSGEVDKNLHFEYRLHAMDYSPKALEVYAKNNPTTALLHKHIILGDITDFKHKEEYDGIYNLGVMEHFTSQDIIKILKQFHKALKPSGKIILFWPPEFGLTVRILRFIKNITGKQFHPDETSLIQSKEQVCSIIEYCGFKVIEYYFGPRDLWTQCVIVAEKYKLEEYTPDDNMVSNENTI